MRWHAMRRMGLGVALGGAISGCDPTALEAEQGGLGVQIQAIRNGQVTDERPEVGRHSGCTATLVAQDVAITASHCLGYRSQLTLGNYDTFIIESGGQTYRYPITRYRSFSRELGADDIALLGLGELVPVDIAQAAPIASETPPLGTSLTVYGYGCTQIGGRGDGRKRKATYEEGDEAAHLCPGDSGGPVFNDETGAVARINSGYWQRAGNPDIYGLTPGLHAELTAQILEWTRGELPQEGEPLDPTLEICGRTADVFERWTCTPSRTHRHRCLPGAAPIWEACDGGCVSGEAGADDVCNPAAAPDDCGDLYRPFTDWICATDDLTLVRCRGGQLEVRACDLGCDATAGAADGCL